MSMQKTVDPQIRSIKKNPICPLFYDLTKSIFALKIAKTFSRGIAPGPHIFPEKRGVICEKKKALRKAVEGGRFFPIFRMEKHRRLCKKTVAYLKNSKEG